MLLPLFFINQSKKTQIPLVENFLTIHCTLFGRKAGVPLEDGWPCAGPLLRLAEDAGSNLIVNYIKYLCLECLIQCNKLFSFFQVI